MSLDALTTPLTREEVEDAIYAALAARGVRTTSWKPGAVVRAIITGVAIVIAGATRLQAAIARGGFLELAEDDWLTLVARYVYGVERDPGSFATSTVTVDNDGGGIYNGIAGDLVFRQTYTGALYRNTAPFTIGALQNGVQIHVQAVELGSGSNAEAGFIGELETPLVGVTVVNSTVAIGTDEEGDESLRVRCREKTGTLSPNGPRDAYAFVARSAKRPNGDSIGITRVLTLADGFGNVTVFVAASAVTVDPADLNIIADAIHRQCEPLAVTPTVESATPYPIDVTYELWVRDTSGLTDEQIEDRVASRLTAFFASQPIGGEVIPGQVGRVYHDAIEAVIGAAMEPQLIDVHVSSPAADVDLEVPEAPVVGTVTATVHQVARGLT
jgi:phage-related baseplate assembly protein